MSTHSANLSKNEYHINNAADELSKYSSLLICIKRGREQSQHIAQNCRSIQAIAQLCSQAVPS
jgi:hypothetical protein